MSHDGILSQEEIDALLNQSGETSDSETLASEAQLTEVEIDALGEIGNISYGSSATALSTILSQRVEITTPQVQVISKERLLEEFNTPYVILQVEFTEGLLGKNLMVLKIRDALVIANIMMGGDGQVNEEDELTELHLSAVQEAMNQMMGSSATAMASLYQRVVNISPPQARVVNMQQESDQLDLEDWLVRIGFRLRVGTLIDSTIMLLIPLSFAKEMVSLLISPSSASTVSEVTAATEVPAAPAGAQAEPASSASMHAEASARQKATAVSSEAGYSTNHSPGELRASASGSPSHQSQGETQQIPVQKPEFTPLFEQKSQVETQNLDILLDIPLHISVELGRTKKMIKEILELAPGSVIELDKLAGEPVDIYVNQKLIARGEVVVIDENFGVRITNILDPRERLRNI
jgi:flagellar motor switch protein FliN/FliY